MPGPRFELGLGREKLPLNAIYGGWEGFQTQIWGRLQELTYRSPTKDRQNGAASNCPLQSHW